MSADMMRVPGMIQRLFATLAAAVPLLVGTDPCTVGALTGHASVVCVARADAVLACVAESARPACPFCGPASAATRSPRPIGETCCDLKPLAPGAAQQPTLAAPHQAAYSVPVVAAVSAASTAAWRGCALAAADESPPRESPAPLSPRAPPLS